MNSFLTNPRAGMKYNQSRMFTRETPNGEGYQLVAYGHEIIAEVTHNEVDFYTAHYSEVSRTVSDWIATFGSVLSNTEGFKVSIYKNEKPNTGIGNRKTQAAKYINNYVAPFAGDFSKVEQDAKREVVEACQEAFNQLTQ